MVEGGLGLGADARVVAKSPAIRICLGFRAERVSAVDAAFEDDGAEEIGSADESDEGGFGVSHLARAGDGVGGVEFHGLETLNDLILGLEVLTVVYAAAEDVVVCCHLGTQGVREGTQAEFRYPEVETSARLRWGTGVGTGGDVVNSGKTADDLEQGSVSGSAEVQPPSRPEDGFDVFCWKGREESMTTASGNAGNGGWW